ncbi:MAG: DUF4199 domain-containing protein, partial [Bacteroidia bacterium]|nr:DUF4199 domain-containing protein [Bacteroidia bacterium]
MEEKQKSVTMNGITWGIVAGILMILYSLILYLMDENLNSSINWIGYLFLIGAMIWGTLEFRKNLPGGFMSYGKAFSASFMIVLFGAILGAIYTYLFFQVIAPEAVNDVIELGRQQSLERNPELTDEQLEQAMQMTSFIYTPFGMTIFGFIGNILVGTIVALITSIFLK